MTHSLTLLATTALDRLDAARAPFIRSWSTGKWLAAAIILIVAAVTIFLAAIVVSRLNEAKRRREFKQRAEEVGISNEEQKLLGHLAHLAGLKQTGKVVDAPEAFDRGADALMSSERVAAMDADLQARTRALVNTLREKLGFSQSEPLDMSRGAVWLGKIPIGTSVEVVRPSSPEPFSAVLSGEEAVAKQIVVEPSIALQASGNESWTLRYAEGGMLWEFDARVVRQEDAGSVVLLPGGKVRCINRRKFARAAVQIPAFVASFPFLRDHGNTDPPTFVPANAVEIAGPGLRLEAPLKIGKGDRVLVCLNVDEHNVMQALGIARRPTLYAEDGPPILVVELIGLTAPDVSDLVRLTNNAPHATQEEPAPAEPVAVEGS